MPLAATKAGITDGPVVESLPALEKRLERFTVDAERNAERARQLAAARAEIARNEAAKQEARRRLEATMKARETARPRAVTDTSSSSRSSSTVLPVGQDCPACRGSGVFYGQQCHRCGGAGWLTRHGTSPGYDPDEE